MKITVSDFLRFSPFDNKINSDFLRQVYSERAEDDVIDKENEFWENFYFDNTKYFQNTINELVEKIQDGNIHFILFKGPSGSGKTTFLKQIIRQKKEFFNDNIDTPIFEMINLIERPIESITGPKLLVSVLHGKIIDVADENLIRKIYYTIANSGKNTSKEIVEMSSSIGSYSSLLNILGSCSEEFSIKELIDYVNSVKDVSEVIALFFIFYIFKRCLTIDELDKNKYHYSPIVFVFDNLDELESKYLVRNLTTDIRDAFSKVQKFFDNLKDTETIAGKYDFVSKCTIIESVRQGFVADVKSCQLKERLDEQSFPLQFDGGYRKSLFEISDIRIGLYQKFQKKTNQDTNQINKDLIEKEKDYIEKLGQLFNYDYRTTLDYLSGALKEDISSWKVFANNDSDCRVGIRGLLLFYVLKSLYIKNDAFEKYVLAELRENSCNRYRMYLSLLSNIYLEETKKKNISEKPYVSLGEFTRRVRTWYNFIPVSSIYSTLFVCDNKNFSLPASLEGEKIDEFYRNEKYNVTLKGLCEYVSRLYKDNPDELNEINIVVNPVCLEYTKRVFINYEYFNLISVADLDDPDSLYGSKSLFQYDTYEDIESCLRRVYKVTKLIINRADEQVCRRCGLKCSTLDLDLKKTMCTTQIASLDENNFLIVPNTLYKTRVVTQHINYLDSFRKMLWLKYHEKNPEKNDIVQKLLLKYINQYIALYRDSRVVNNSAEDAISDIEKDYAEACRKGSSEWYSVKIGR